MNNPGNSEHDSNETGTNNDAGTVTFTPEQHAKIDELMTAKKAEVSRKAAAAERATIEEYLDAQQAEASRAEMEEIDRLKAERDDALASAAAATEAANHIQASSRAGDALRAAGIDSKAISRAIGFIDLAAEDIDGEVAQLKQDLPALFVGDAQAPPAPHITPTGVQPHTGGKSALDRAIARRDAANSAA